MRNPGVVSEKLSLYKKSKESNHFICIYFSAMGASSSIMDRAGAIPDQVDEAFCKAFIGETFDSKEFRALSNKETSLIPREAFIKAVLKRTDCFLTHDWGNYQDGFRNHALVSLVNRGLQDRGLTTWFDQEQMQVSQCAFA